MYRVTTGCQMLWYRPTTFDNRVCQTLSTQREGCVLTVDCPLARPR